MTDTYAMAVWDASQTPTVQGFAMRLWGTRDGAADGIQEAILYALSRERWYDAAKGKLSTWLCLILKSIKQAARSKGHRRGTVATPRVFCPGDDAMPELVDLCDPESLLIARQTDVTALEAQRARDSRPTPRKLTPEDVTFIRASNLRGTVLARRFKVSDNTISKIRSGKTPNASYRTTREERKEAHGH